MATQVLESSLLLYTKFFTVYVVKWDWFIYFSTHLSLQCIPELLGNVIRGVILHRFFHHFLDP
jgi:hypothetical protein